MRFSAETRDLELALDLHPLDTHIQMIVSETRKDPKTWSCSFQPLKLILHY